MSRWRTVSCACLSRRGWALVLAAAAPWPALPALADGASPVPTGALAEEGAAPRDQGRSGVGTGLAPSAHGRAAEDEELWFEVRLGPEVLADQLVAFRRGEAVLVPLAALSRKLGLAIRVDDDHAGASGFLLQEARTFRLDALGGEARVAGEARPFDPALVKRGPDDLYVDAALLSRWMPLDFEADPYALRLRVVPREPLPMQQRLERLRRYQRLQAELAPAELPRLEDRFGLFAPPALDQSVTLAMRQLPAGGSAFEGSYASFATGDLLYMSAAMFATGDQLRPLSDFRLSLGRKEPEPRLLGPLRAREFTFGNVQVPGLPLVSRPQAGNGLVVSSYPIDMQSQFDSHNFRGPLPPGWDVELYHNGAVAGYQGARPDGLYAFEAVPLRPGMNEFRLVFYGPQGQRREEIHRFNVGASLAPEGEQRYRSALVFQEDGQARFQAQHDVGLTRHLTAGWGLTSLPSGLDRRTYGLGGLRGYWGPIFAHADGAVDARGAGGELGLQARLGPIDLGGRHARLANLMSDVFADATVPIAGRTQLEVQANAAPFPQLSVSAGLQARRDEQAAGAIAHRLTLPAAASYGRLSMRHQLAWDLNPALGGEPRLEGMLQAAWRMTPLGLRGQLDYGTAGLTGLMLGTNGMPWQGQTLQASVSYVKALDDWRYELTLTRDMGAFSLATSARQMGQSGAMFATTASAGASHDPPRDRWHAQGETAAAAGAASVRVFLDENMNGRRDEDEAPIAGAEVQALGRPAVRTGPDGIAHVSGLTSYQDALLTLKATTLEDPLWQPASPGLAFVPRPGRTAVVDVPIVATAEVTGTARLIQGAERRAIAGVAVELVDAGGHVSHEARSAYDGFFAIVAVPPGSYTLRVAPAQAEALALRGLPSRPIVVPPGGGFLDDMDLLLERDEAVLQ